MRVAILLTPPIDRPTGGYLVQYEYANELVRQGHRVTVVHPWAQRPFGSAAMWRDYGRELARVTVRRRPIVPWFAFDPRVRLRLVPFLHARLIPRADATVFTAWQTVAAFAGSLPVNAWQMVFDYEFWQAHPELRPAMRAVFSRPGIHRIATSSAVRAMLDEAGTTAAATITCGLDLERWRCERDQDRAPLVGFPLRDEPHKGMDEAFAALARVAEGRPDARFACFGEAQTRAPARVDSRGRLSDAALRDFYNECAVFLLPSRFEGWGLPAAEAMACGAALVTTANGGTDDFAVDGVNALVVAPGDAEAMAGAVSRLLGDRELRSRLAAGGVARASELSWAQAARRLVDVLGHTPAAA